MYIYIYTLSVRVYIGLYIYICKQSCLGLYICLALIPPPLVVLLHIEAKENFLQIPQYAQGAFRCLLCSSN